jgi:hypothetical protein
MAIEHTPDVGTMVTGEHVHLFRLMALESALALEILMPGMRMSKGSVMMAAKRITGSPKRTKKGVLADLVAYTTNAFPDHKPIATVQNALKKS